MRKQTHLATFILLAPSLALAQWHTNEPYAAWPATNHLRWMTNAVTTTNDPVWTNANYGAWTGNYVVVAGYWTDDPYNDWGGPRYSPIYFENYWGDVAAMATNLMLQAKDARMWDCSRALMERHQVLAWSGVAGTPSNFWQRLTPHSSYVHADHFPALYRSEVHNLEMLRLYVRDIHTNFFVASPTGGPPIALTVSSLCARASVPSNFLSVARIGSGIWTNVSYWRTASGAWTPYGRIVTCEWTMACTGTNVCTNTTVDSFGNAVTITGTNGQVVTRVVTNNNILAGYRAEDYNWDALRRCITNLTMTRRDISWGVGHGSNYVENYYDERTNEYHNLTPLHVTSRDNLPTEAEASNSWFIGSYGYAEPFTNLSWSWTWTLTNETAICQTNVAPSATAFANASFQAHCSIRYMEADSDPASSDFALLNAFGSYPYNAVNYRAHTNQWSAYNAPLVAARSGNLPAARTATFWVTTNGTAFAWFATNSASSVTNIVTPDYSIALPEFPAFGISTSTVPSKSVGHIGDPPRLSDCSWSRIGSHSVQTNYTLPTVGKVAVFEEWEFTYK